MGKKARKTRWKALSIEEPRSDCSSPVFENSKSYSSKTRYGGAQNGSGAHQKYTSSHSTPTHQLRHHRDRWALQKDQGKTTTSTRSNSTCSETKITFNEEEYTKITTPRQDVLFKKGYLSKPKPYLQRPLTSAGTSTGDGTPDHQSADGADYPDNDFDAFPYPSPGVEVYNPNLCYVNYEMANSTAPMILYDNFGNSVVYYPPPAGLPPHCNHDYHPESTETCKKRYSIDSASQNTTPNNETNENYENISEPEVFEGARMFPGPVVGEISASNPPELEPSNTNLTSDDKTVEETQNDGDCNTTPSDSEPQITPENSINSGEESTKHKYRVDAEEFVPRGFVSNYNFVPFCPPEFFGGHFVILPPFNNFYPVPTIEPTEQASMVQDVSEDAATQNVAGQGIDIQRIVSKLEQAAQEQNLRVANENCDKSETDEVETTKIDEHCETETNKEENTTITDIKLETLPTPIETPEPVQKYSDRLKSTSNTARQSKHVVQKVPPKPPAPAPASATATYKTCPRLHRQASKALARGTSGPETFPRNLHTTHCSPNVQKHGLLHETKCQKTVVSDTSRCDVIAGAAKEPKLVPVDPSDSWVSVNSRKKRKNPKNKTNEIIPNNLGNCSDSSDQNTDFVGNLLDSEPASTLPIISDAQNIQPDVDASAKTAAIAGGVKKEVKQQKENKNKSIGGKKPIKKRVLVTDECIGIVLTPCSEKDTVCNTDNVEEQKKSKPAEIETIPQVQVTPSEPTTPVLATVETKKPKKKRNKSKIDISCTSTDSDLNISNSSDSLGLLETSDQSTVAVDVSEVELELEKMIQRGLYANLEQKLGKSDSFLGNLNNSNPFGTLFSPPKLLNNTILPSFPQIVVPTKSSSLEPEAAEPPKQQQQQQQPPRAEECIAKLSVTEAVKQWIDKTRETTPEVEIFRKPEDIREGMLSKVLHEGDEGDSDAGDEFVGPASEQQDAQVDRTARDAASLLESRRSRSNSIDIMEYWDDDLHSVVPGDLPHDLEHAEDALESVEVYESVYGSSRDFERIRNEVNSNNSRHSRFFSTQNRNNSLPYRAICCSVM